MNEIEKRRLIKKAVFLINRVEKNLDYMISSIKKKNSKKAA